MASLAAAEKDDASPAASASAAPADTAAPAASADTADTAAQERVTPWRNMACK